MNNRWRTIIDLTYKYEDKEIGKKDIKKFVRTYLFLKYVASYEISSYEFGKHIATTLYLNKSSMPGLNMSANKLRSAWEKSRKGDVNWID